MTRPLSIAAIAAFGVLMPALAHAEAAAGAGPGAPGWTDQGAAPQASRADVHDGFMLRMSSGYAAIGVGINPDASEDVGAVAGGPSLNLIIGRSIVPNLMLHADFMAVGASNVRAGEGDSSRYDAEAFGLGAAGLGMTYFIMPYNLSLSGSLMVAGFGLETRDDHRYSTDYALLGKFGIGKEWSVSERWALGVGSNVFVGSGRGHDSADEKFDTGLAGASVNFTATYN